MDPGKEPYTDQSEFPIILQKAADAQADVLYMPDYYNLANLVGAQAKDRGSRRLYWVGMAGNNGSRPECSGRRVFTNHYAPDDPSSIVQDWVQVYEGAYGSTPDAIATLAYDLTNMLLAAIEKAGEDDPALVKETLAGLMYDAVTGITSFDESEQPH